MHSGFILTQKDTVKVRQTHLIYSGICKEGPFRLIFTNSRPLFFIKRSTTLPTKFVPCEQKEVDLKTFDESPVNALYFNTKIDRYNALKILKSKGIQTWESDIDIKERFLMERFINGEIEFKGKYQKKGDVLEFVNPEIRKGIFKPAFKVFSLDIETGGNGELYSAAYYQPGPDKTAKHVLMIGDPEKSSRDLTFYSSEKELLINFLHHFNKLDPDIIIGWNIIGFDLRFLDKKYNYYKIPFLLGRDRSSIRIIELSGSKYIADIDGRIVIDGPTALRSAFHKFENFKLDTVALELLGEGKDIKSSENIVKEIEHRFQKDKEALAFYNLKDCELTWRIFENTSLIDHIFTRAVISGMRMDKIGKSVAAFDHFMLPEIHRKGIVAPNIIDITAGGHAAGGWVFNPQPGLYENVIVLDFKSLYPSIIKTFKIDPLSRLKAGINPVKTPAGIDFSSSEHILPGYIEKLMIKRDSAKKNSDENLSQAIKILMNSFYGVMGTTGCRFYHRDLPSAITETGQWLLKETSNYLCNEEYTVLYGDTDSVFIKLKKEEVIDPDAAGKKMASRINRYFTNRIKHEYRIESYLEIEYEKYYRKFYLPVIRNGSGGAKKRYAGLQVKKGEEELTFTGMEVVRSDWTRLAKDFQYELFRRVFYREEIVKWIKAYIQSLKNHEFDNNLIYKKRLRKKAGEYKKTIPPHVKAALLLDPSKRENLKEVLYIITKRGPIPIELPHTDIDYNHYIEKQLKPLADGILHLFNLSFDTIFKGSQLTLF